MEWEWEQKKGEWVRYESEVAEKLRTAVDSGSAMVEVEIGKSALLIDLQQLTQKNKNTGFQRQIRCVFKDENDGNYYAWEWEDEKGRWRSYPASVGAELEKAPTNDQSVKFSVAGRNYAVDLTEMTQTNEMTDAKRRVQRVKSQPQEAPESGTRKRKAEEEADEKPLAKKSGKSAASSRKSAGGNQNGAGTSKKTLLLKGRAPVDPECTAKLGTAHVYFEGNDVYDVMLNQTNLQNNNNKYYIIQLLEEDNAKRYSVWFRWGRVGFKGQSSLTSCGGDLEDAKESFCQKFFDKTKNEWGNRKKFKKVPGKYDMIQLDYCKDDKREEVESKAEEEEEVEQKPKPESKLDKRVQNLLRLICDIKAMEETVVEMEYDAQKAPLGKLTPAQIKAGYSALKTIETCIQGKDLGSKLLAACNEYYTRIPHCFGMRRPPLIRDSEALKKEMELLEALEEIEVALRTLKTETQAEEAPIDAQYRAMRSELQALSHDSEEFKMVERYMRNTHAATHSMYKMRPMEVFVCSRQGQEEAYKDCGNKQLLWHGSRLSNWCGILSQGLRIAPPEAPATGYMFGKGVYFADISSKSANYCFPTPQKNTGLLLLCEVSLGKSKDLIAADYKADKLTDGFQSVRGLGKLAPDPADTITLEDGVSVPLGHPQETGVANPSGYTLNYNEFVVYNTAQIKVRYLVQTEFIF